MNGDGQYDVKFAGEGGYDTSFTLSAGQYISDVYV